MRKPAAVLVGLLVVMSTTASAEGAGTIRLYSVTASETLRDAQGKVTAPNKPPAVGYRYYSSSVTYLGNRRRHARKAVGFQHVGCLLTSLSDTDTFGTICDVQLALPRGVIFVDQSPESALASTAVYKITGGLGRYRKAKGGTVTSKTVSPDASDLIVKY